MLFFPHLTLFLVITLAPESWEFNPYFQMLISRIFILFRVFKQNWEIPEEANLQADLLLFLTW